jgi:hypothetical protein
MSSVSLPLDQPRAIVIRHKEKKFVYRFRRIGDSDWLRYYAGIISQTETVNNDQVRCSDFRAALHQLVESTLQSVEGYTAPNGLSMETMSDWKLKLPIGHKTQVGLMLVDVSVEERDVSVLTDLNEISLTATWAASPEQQMLKYSGLIHRFQHPTIEQMRRFYRESSRTRVVGGSRTGKTIWTGRQELLAHFYDELIASVDGYTVAGVPLTEASQIKAQMDTHHKVAAAQALFSAGEESEPVAADSQEAE